MACENAIVNLEGNVIVFCFFQGAESAGRAATAMSASDTQAVSMAPVSNPGSVTARKAGGASSATRVSPSLYGCQVLSKQPDAHWKSRSFLYLILGFLPLSCLRPGRSELLHSPQAMQEWGHLHQHGPGELHVFLSTWVHRCQL